MAYSPIVTDLGMKKYDEFYPGIKYYYSNFDDKKDNTLLSMIRMLFSKNRLDTFCPYEDEGSMQVLFEDSKFEIYEEDNADDIFKEMFDGDRSTFGMMKRGIYVCILKNDNADQIYDKMKSFDGNNEARGWKHMPDIETYIDRTGKSYVYQNEKAKAVCVYTDKTKRYQVIHLIASCLPRLFPWAFEKNPLTEEETATLATLFDKDGTGFVEKIAHYIEVNDFYTKKMKGILGNFFFTNYGRAVQDGEDRVKNCRDDIDSLLRRVSEARKKLEEEMMRVLILRNKALSAVNDTDEVIDFMRANKDNLFLLRRGDGYIRIGVNCFLEDYDEDMYNTYIDGETSMSAYAYENSPYTLEQTKRLYNAIWKSRRFKLRVYCEWKLKSDCMVEACSYSSMGERDELTKDRLPQPHIDRYTCYDGYKLAFRNLADNMDYIGVLSTILCSSKSINWTDSTVVRYLTSCMFGNRDSTKCLEDADGSLYTIDEVVKILEEENKAA